MFETELFFDFETVYLCWTELFEIQLFIWIKLDLALITKIVWFALKLNQTKPSKVPGIVVIMTSQYIWTRRLKTANWRLDWRLKTGCYCYGLPSSPPQGGAQRSLYVTDWNSSGRKTENDRYFVGNCVYNFITPTHFRFNPRELLTPSFAAFPFIQVRPAITLFTQLEHPALSIKCVSKKIIQ